ncbi:type VI secretion system tip protein TssI/VgrG [Pseudomonas sp. NA-150]|uniref:type VI secretion system tip protein TssI/VgrG n=1 Tax=Pseudomonas sp. NA-150 TaxID=3367525 RepID=UPI0037C77121
MSNVDNAPIFTFNIKGEDHLDLRVLEFNGSEGLSQLFKINIELVTRRSSVDLDSLLNKEAFLSFGPGGEGIYGCIYAAGKGRSSSRFEHYHVVLTPYLAYLQHSSHRRSFQDMTVPNIILAVLKEHRVLDGLDVMFDRLTTTAGPREYCVQYDESDFAFISRLCEEEGILYRFEHTPQSHRLIFLDDETRFLHDNPMVLPLKSPSGLVPEGPVVRLLQPYSNTRQSQVITRDYDFKNAHIPLENVASPRQTQAQLQSGEKPKPLPKLEDYPYPGGYTEGKQGNLRAERGLERHRTDAQIAKGESDQPLLRSGMALHVVPGYGPTTNWVLMTVTHHGKQPQALEEQADTSPVERYSNTFTVIPELVQFRPPRKHSISKIGTVPAIVTGPVNEEIFCDKFGRVRVKFCWDRSDKTDETTSCWVRVVTGSAGEGFGSVVIPRVGMEVAVSFYHDDPSQPFISGCAANNLHPTPYELPDNKTKSVFRSRSTPDSTGFNELSLEDRSGEELIYVRAQRDMKQNIQNDSHIQIGNKRLENVKGDSTCVLEAKEDRTTTGERSVQLMAGDNLQIATSRHMSVGQVLAVRAGNEVHIQAGMNVVINAGATLTLAAGGQHIVIGTAGISSSVPILLGGFPVPGTPAMPLAPGGLQGLVAGALAPAAPPLEKTLRRKMELGLPHCEACELAKGDAQ